MKKLTLLTLTLGLLLTSCDPEPCVDRYEFTYSDGTTEWVEVEYDCDDIYYTPYYY